MRHGLPNAYPYNEPGFTADQAKHAHWFRFVGPTEQTVSVSLTPGELYELWPGGDLFNSAGSLIGQLRPASKP